ncbi:MAG: glycosyltransferase, partial [Polyangiaceae bacterium]
IISAPVREQPGDNPHHRHCFRAESLRALVAEGFSVEEELWQAGAYLTLVAQRREIPCLAWRAAPSNEPPPATIVLVTWNAHENVVLLVSAIRALSRPPYDLLVVDNASTDGTRSFLHLFDGEPGFRLLANTSNKKCAAATNQALAVARTEFVIYLCASHAIVTDEGWNERLVRWLAERPEIPIAGDVWDPGFVVASRRYAPGFDPEALPPEKRRHVQGGAWIARRAALVELGGLNEAEHPHGGTDVELSLLLTSRGSPLGACPEVLCPQAPRLPERRAGVSVYHPATPAFRDEVRQRLGLIARGERPVAMTSGPLPVGWSCPRGEVRGLGARAFHVRAHGSDSGLISDASFEDVRIRGRVQSHGIANVKARIDSRDDPAADGYHVLLG